MNNQYSVCGAVSFFHDGAGVKHTCMGIDIQAARPTPIGKRFGVDENAHHGMSAASLDLLLFFGFHAPFVECVRETIAIGHDPKDGAVIFESVPGYADGAYVLRSA